MRAAVGEGIKGVHFSSLHTTWHNTDYWNFALETQTNGCKGGRHTKNYVTYLTATIKRLTINHISAWEISTSRTDVEKVHDNENPEMGQFVFTTFYLPDIELFFTMEFPHHRHKKFSFQLELTNWLFAWFKKFISIFSFK